MLAEADDLLAECEALAALLEGRPEDDYRQATRFKSWTVDDVLVHLHFWNRAADMSLNAPQEFAALMDAIGGAIASFGMRAIENARIAERGPELLRIWLGFARDMAARWRDEDPKRRVKWAGPEMSLRSSVTARQMETWAHAQAVFDLFGVERQEADRIRNIVVLGVNTYGWSFKVRGMTPPDPMPALSLTAPSGEIWTFGADNGRIEGAAADFCRVVAQTRNIADTGLSVEGEAARLWMANAQCFAGPPETPPPPGTRIPGR